MTGWLASVTTVREARMALASGAHIIDAKNPLAGALGALDSTMVADIVAAVAGKVPVSATVGDFPSMDAGRVSRAVDLTGSTGVDYVKIGLFAAPGLDACLSALGALAHHHRLIAVMFADQSPDIALLPRLADLGFQGVMLDTAGKGGGGLLDHQSLKQLAAFVQGARNLGLLCGLAGSLRQADIPRLLPLAPDYLGFRGALCEEQMRSRGLSLPALVAIAEAMRQPQVQTCIQPLA